MSERDPARERPRRGDGSTTAAAGTPVPVDTSIDREARLDLVTFLSGPIVWAAHFFLVYLVAEAGCTGEGPGLRVFDPPVPTVVTLVATVVAAVACLGCTVWSHRRWRSGRRRRDGTPDAPAGGTPDVRSGSTLTFAGLLLAPLSFISVLMVGVPALVLSPC